MFKIEQLHTHISADREEDTRHVFSFSLSVATGRAVSRWTPPPPLVVRLIVYCPLPASPQGLWEHNSVTQGVLFQSLRNLYLHSEPSAGSRRTALNASHPSWTQWWTNSCFSTRTSSFRSEGIGVLCIATLQRFITNIIIFKLILNEWSVDWKGIL